MSTKTTGNLAILSLVLSVVALGLAAPAFYWSMRADLDDAQFNARVEKGINDFIAKKQGETAGAPSAPAKPIDVSIDDDPIKGDKNAPVTLVEFSDFQCPYCASFVQGALPQIISEYIDKGKVRLVYRDFPLSFHANARPAALAANCAREQGGDAMFFKYHDKLFANQEGLGVENLKKWATELSLNASKFNSCLETAKYASEVDKDFQEGQSYGVSGTPAFFVNGRLISGAQPFSTFKTAIDEELSKKGQ